jgi:hypothetical protein
VWHVGQWDPLRTPLTFSSVKLKQDPRSQIILVCFDTDTAIQPFTGVAHPNVIYGVELIDGKDLVFDHINDDKPM